MAARTSSSSRPESGRGDGHLGGRPADPLAHYWSKRDFGITPEPRGVTAKAGKALSFVIQKHAASRLHYDFRLEIDGVLVSWAVPKGPSYDPFDKRLAVHVEDHPLSYGAFEGTIPPGQYGAGTVIVWDEGVWEPVGDPREGLAKGKLVFALHGHKMEGLWELVKIAKGGEKQEPWLLFKKRDEFAQPRTAFDVVSALPDSVIAKPLKSVKKEAMPEKAKKTSALVKAPESAKALKATSAVKAAKTSRKSDAIMPGAIKAPLPEKLTPQLATLATGIPSTGHWLYELKFDGYRLMARFVEGQPTLITRGGHDWSAKMPTLVAELKQLGIQSGWLDGEIVMLGDEGTPDFNALQTAFDRHTRAGEITYFLFDIPFFEGHDLRQARLDDRRQLLKTLLEPHLADKGSAQATPHLRFSEAFEADPASVLSSACRMHMEGVIAKRSDAPYVSTRSESWLKLKCKQRQEFIVCGYTDRSDGRPQIGSLVLGVNDEQGRLVSVGSVGTGWDAEEAASLRKKLAKLVIDESPFPAGPGKRHRWSRREPGSEHWVQPKLVAEVEFAEWTPDSQIRHAAYIALRTDKPAKAIVREKAKSFAGEAPQRSAGSKAVGGIQVSHGERVIDASTGLTKLELVRYYESVAEWILPHLQGRPCALVRGPEGVGGQLFFQKHGGKTGIPHITELDPALWPGHEAMLVVDSAEALVSAAQLNVIEFHTWNATARKIELPDRMIFDLDPGEGTKWSDVQEAALLVKTMLDELGLQSWLKTSGGKGLHVVVPLTPRLDHDTVKAFSKAIVQHLARTIPSRFVAKSGASNRIGKIFIDYLRNGRGATTVAAFSARARPGLGVSMPVAWDELQQLKSGAHWTVATAREYLSLRAQDPWQDYASGKQSLTAAMKAIGFKRD